MSATVLIPGGAKVTEDQPRNISPITDRERRVISKLAIPWSVPGLTHRLLIDEFTGSASEQQIHDELILLALKGLCVNLGSRTSPAKVVSAAQNHPDAIDLPDERADIYARRMALPARSYRCQGDTWMLTSEGLEALKAPVIECDPLTPSQISDIILREFRRVAWEYDGENTPGTALHPDVYAAWLPQVVAECEDRWGVRPRVPIAGGASGWADVWENYILDHENQKTSLAVNDAITTPWYMSLTILAYDDTITGSTHGDGSHVPTYTGYAAKDVAAASMNAASAGSSANNAAIQFAACTAGSSTIVGFGNNSVVGNTSGIFRKWGDCTSTTVSTTQTPAQFAASAYTTTAN